MLGGDVAGRGQASLHRDGKAGRGGGGGGERLCSIVALSLNHTKTEALTSCRLVLSLFPEKSFLTLRGSEKFNQKVRSAHLNCVLGLGLVLLLSGDGLP